MFFTSGVIIIFSNSSYLQAHLKYFPILILFQQSLEARLCIVIHKAAKNIYGD